MLHKKSPNFCLQNVTTFSELQLKELPGTSSHAGLCQAEINPFRVTRIHLPEELLKSRAIESHDYAPRRGRSEQNPRGRPDCFIPVVAATLYHLTTVKWTMRQTRVTKFQDSRRSSGRSRHANHPGSSPAVQEKITPHIPQKKSGRPIFNFPPYFFKVADLRFNTFLDTKRAIRRCWRSLRALRMLPMDYPSNSTLNGMFALHFRKRSLAKIQKIPKNLPGR